MIYSIRLLACGPVTGDVGCREPTYSPGSAVVLGLLIVVVIGVAIWIHRANKGRKRKEDGEVWTSPGRVLRRALRRAMMSFGWCRP